MATPLVFTPVKHGDRTLLDGAVVNPVPIARTGRKEIDDEQMNLGLDERSGLFDKCSELRLAALVAWRNELDDGDNIAMPMAHPTMTSR